MIRSTITYLPIIYGIYVEMTASENTYILSEKYGHFLGCEQKENGELAVIGTSWHYNDVSWNVEDVDVNTFALKHGVYNTYLSAQSGTY